MTMPTHDCRNTLRIAALLEAGDIDAALESGLMEARPCPACDASATEDLRAAQHRLANAWAARERHRAREARLQRIASERASRHATPQAQQQSLPPAAAAILARAKAKAAQHGQQ